MALLEGADRTQEIDPTKCWPEHIGEMEFAVGTLPQQETGEPDFAARPDDQVGIWQGGGIEIGTDRIRGHQRNRLFECFSGIELFAQKRLDGVGDLLPPTIGRGDCRIHSRGSLGRSFGRAYGRERRRRQQPKLADGAHANALTMNLRIARQR
jgi:hypothetical protein